MDNVTFAKTALNVEVGKPSRLPAGSTLEVAPGVHVPHPHAEVNLPGAGDNRRGETGALTEDLSGKQRPLADEVRPASLTVASGARAVVRATPTVETPTAAEAEEKLAVDPTDKTSEAPRV